MLSLYDDMEAVFLEIRRPNTVHLAPDDAESLRTPVLKPGVGVDQQFRRP